ncbi:tetratricopeptide repeat protein [Nonomuraea sp. NPDC059007]|uniref:tetratricopeptide repeat protein n=1 Tax=Nonomuraea sp. NPDC059007 TaxID=3346692 RepID=UPI0036AF3957
MDGFFGTHKVGDRYGEGMALNNLGIALTEVRRFEEAITGHKQATAIFREVDDDHLLSIAQRNLAEDLRLQEES